jgi:hypothetical protein
VAVLVEAVAAEVPHVLLVDPWSNVIELAQHSMLGDVNNNLSAQHSTAQHSTAQHSTAQHSTAQHDTAWTQQDMLQAH